MPQHPDRHWRLQGATNFRDLGGYLGHGGRRVQWRRMFRSDHLAGLTDADVARLRELGLAYSFDFRGTSERAHATYTLQGLTQHHLAIEPTVAQRMHALVKAGHGLTPDDMVGLMEQLYEGLASQQAHRFAELFEHLIAAEGPLVFHCTAGKDRTGFAAAMVLAALGVSRDTIMRDYLLTNQHYRHPPLPDTGTPQEVLQVLWRVRESFLTAAWREIDTRHGGVDRYLASHLKLTPAALVALRERYLEPLSR